MPEAVRDLVRLEGADGEGVSVSDEVADTLLEPVRVIVGDPDGVGLALLEFVADRVPLFEAVED